MDESRIRVEMEDGMWFEFSGREDEEQELDVPDMVVFERGFLSPFIFARSVFFDVRNPDENHNHQVVGVHRRITRREIVPGSTMLLFEKYIGHGLSPLDLENCTRQLSSVVDRLVAASPKNIDHGYAHSRRQFTFDVKRVGVVGTRYNAREIEMQEEEGECRRRMVEMLKAGVCPANPEKVDEILGKTHSHYAIKKGQDCSICLEGFKWGEFVTRIPCDHYYHTVCIAPWFYRNNTCPTCRYALPPMYVPFQPSCCPNPYL